MQHMARYGLSTKLSFCAVEEKCWQYALYWALLLVVTVFLSAISYSVSVGKQFFSSFHSGTVQNTWKISMLYLSVILALHYINYMQSK